MLKTNIRINNAYLIHDDDNDDYYISSCTQPNKWKKIKASELSKFKRKKVTRQLKKLQKKYGEDDMINYVVPSISKKSKKKRSKKKRSKKKKTKKTKKRSSKQIVTETIQSGG